MEPKPPQVGRQHGLGVRQKRDLLYHGFSFAAFRPEAQHRLFDGDRFSRPRIQRHQPRGIPAFRREKNRQPSILAAPQSARRFRAAQTDVIQGRLKHRPLQRPKFGTRQIKPADGRSLFVEHHRFGRVAIEHRQTVPLWKEVHRVFQFFALGPKRSPLRLGRRPCPYRRRAKLKVIKPSRSRRPHPIPGGSFGGDLGGPGPGRIAAQEAVASARDKRQGTVPRHQAFRRLGKFQVVGKRPVRVDPAKKSALGKRNSSIHISQTRRGGRSNPPERNNKKNQKYRGGKDGFSSHHGITLPANPLEYKSASFPFIQKLSQVWTEKAKKHAPPSWHPTKSLFIRLLRELPSTVFLVPCEPSQLKRHP